MPQSSASMVGKGLTDRTLRTLMERFARPLTEKEFRDRALFHVMVATALRAAEVVQLRWSQSFRSPEGLRVFTFRKKGGKTGYCVPGGRALAAVRAYQRMARVRSDEFFLCLPGNIQDRKPLSARGLRYIIRAWDVQTAAGRTIHCHALRHTAAQMAFDKGGSIAAQLLCGHSSPDTTARYYMRPYIDASGFFNQGRPAAPAGHSLKIEQVPDRNLQAPGHLKQRANRNV